MSNRIDFFQPNQTRLAIAGATVSVLVDGTLCPWVELIEIVQSGWPDFSWARLAYNEAVYPQGEAKPIEEIESRLAMGKSVGIRQVYNAGVPAATACSLPIFAGRIEKMETKFGPEGESLEVMVKDFSAELKRVTVYGQRVGKSDGSTLFLTGADTIFNDDGKANATAGLSENNGYSYKTFCVEPSQSELWSYAEVIYYLLCEYLPPGQLRTPDIEQLRGLTGNQKASDLDVTGLSLLDALRRCCDRIGLEFKFVPRLSRTGPSQQIVFYKNVSGRVVELNCQRQGEKLSISKTNISRLHSRKNFWPLTHKYIGQGDFRVYEATFDLVKAWDSADEGTDYDTFSPSANPDFYKVKDVYRKWCLNEAGDYTASPYNRGGTFDFSKIFGSSNFVSRRRRFWPTLTTDKQGKSLGCFLQVSFDNGSSWRQYLGAFENRLDECGIWLSSDQLDVETWVAALKGSLKFRMTASVISDERLTCHVADGPLDSAVEVIDHIITLPRQFKYRRISNRSIFFNSSDQSLGVPDEVDDSAALYEFVRKKAMAGSEAIETIDVQTPYLAFDYKIGDRVTTNSQSRDLLSCRSDNRSISWIKQVQMDFEKQCTNLKIVRQRKLSV